MAAPLTLNDTYQGDFECFTCCKVCSCPPHQPWQMPDGEKGTVLRIEDFASILEPELLAGLLWKRTAMQTEVERIAGLEPSRMEGQVRGEDYQYCPTCKAPIALEDGCNHVACDCGENFCFFCGEVAEEHSGHWEAPDGCPQYGNARLPQPARYLPLPPAEERDLSCTTWRNDSIRGDNDNHAIGTWAWNVAMHNSTPALRYLMQPFVRTTMSDDMHAGWPHPEHSELVVSAMMDWTREYGVTREEWAALTAERAQRWLTNFESGRWPEYFIGFNPRCGPRLCMFFELSLSLHRNFIPARDGETYRPRHNNDIFSREGLLRQPVSGLFSLSLDDGRHEAANWILKSLNSNTTDWSGPDSYAVLFCAPGGTPESHLIGAEIQTSLYGRRGRTSIWLPHSRRSVTFAQCGTSSGIIVHVSDQEVHVCPREGRHFTPLIVMADQSMRPEDQDEHLESWILKLFTESEEIFGYIRVVWAAETDEYFGRPSTLYISGNGAVMSWDGQPEDPVQEVVADDQRNGRSNEDSGMDESETDEDSEADEDSETDDDSDTDEDDEMADAGALESWIDDEMADVSREDEGHQEAGEEYVRFHLRS